LVTYSQSRGYKPAESGKKRSRAIKANRALLFQPSVPARKPALRAPIVSSVKEYVGQAAWEQAGVGRLCLFAFYKASLPKDSKGIKSGIRYPGIGP